MIVCMHQMSFCEEVPYKKNERGPKFWPCTGLHEASIRHISTDSHVKEFERVRTCDSLVESDVQNDQKWDLSKIHSFIYIYNVLYVFL